MSIINHTLIKYMLFHTYLDLLPLNLVYVVLENDNFVLENGNFALENYISLAVGTMLNYCDALQMNSPKWNLLGEKYYLIVKIVPNIYILMLLVINILYGKILSVLV